jgi:hypothetical protein
MFFLNCSDNFCIGIPKQKRGQIWQFFIEQKKLGTNPATIPSRFSHLKLDTTYEQLLRQLTSQQHAILIDLGNKLSKCFF